MCVRTYVLMYVCVIHAYTYLCTVLIRSNKRWRPLACAHVAACTHGYTQFTLNFSRTARVCACVVHELCICECVCMYVCMYVCV